MKTLLLLGLLTAGTVSAADLGFRPVYMHGDTGEISCDRSSGPRRFSSAASMEYFEVPRSGNIYAYVPPHEQRDERCTRLWRGLAQASTSARKPLVAMMKSVLAFGSPDAAARRPRVGGAARPFGLGSSSFSARPPRPGLCILTAMVRLCSSAVRPGRLCL